MLMKADSVARQQREPMLIWSGETRADETRSNLVLWAGRPAAPNQRSLVAYLETHAVEVRRRYLAWTHDLGETLIMGRSIRRRFVSRDGSNLWVQSLFFEQSTWKQDSLETMLKLFALQLLLDEERPTSVEFAGADSVLSAVLRRICKRRGIRYTSRRLVSARPWVWRASVRAVPAMIGALAALGRLALRSRVLRPPAIDEVTCGGRRVLICGPFFNYLVDPSTGRDFTSSYWGVLPQALAEGNSHIEWLHYFYGNSQALRAREARRLVDRMNSIQPTNARHSFVEAYATPLLVLRVAGEWLRIAATSVLVGLVLRSRFNLLPTESYWPLIRRDWARTFRGHGCIENLFYGACFDRALGLLPRQNEGLYLMENQPWERALARAAARKAQSPAA